MGLSDFLNAVTIERDVIITGETDSVEFKKSFNWNGKGEYSKAMVSMANNKGGFIIFGVENGTGKVIGLSDNRFEELDGQEVSGFLNSSFQPSFEWYKYSCPVGTMKIGIIEVEESKKKPIIAIKNQRDGIKESDIFFRYNSRNDRIKHGDLIKLLDQEKKKFAREIMSAMNVMIERDPENMAMFERGQLEKLDQSNTYLIDSSNLHDIKFIKEGEFYEKEGAPAIRLIGVAGIANTTIYKEITIDMVVKSFLKKEILGGFTAFDYIRHLPNESSGMLPVYFFIHKAGIKFTDAIKIISESRSRNQGKRTLLKRLNGGDNNFSIIVKVGKRTLHKTTLLRLDLKKKLLNGKIDTKALKTVDKRILLEAVRMLNKREVINIYDTLKIILISIFDEFYGDTEMLTHLRDSLCHIDKLLWEDKIEK